jgi:hypothetical protein
MLAGCGNIVSRAGVDPGDGSTSSGTPHDHSSPDDPYYGGYGCGCGTYPSEPSTNNLAQTSDDGATEVQLASYLQMCSTFDEIAGCGVEPTWRISFELPATAQPGDVFALDQNGFLMETDALDGSDPEICGAGGGTFWDGTVEVLSDDGAAFTVRLSGTANLFFAGESADGDYVVTRCGGAPPVPAIMTSAVASFRADGTLDLTVSSLASTCEDPSPGSDCSQAAQNVFISLPPSMQAPGTYSLDQIATFSASEPGGAGECSGGGGSYWGGQIEVLMVEDAYVYFLLSGTDDLLLPHGNADGSFNAPLCSALE